MRRILAMVAKDLRRQRRAPMAMLFVLAFPLIFASLLALTFGRGGDRVPRVSLLVDDRDGSMLSGLLLSGAGDEQLSRYFDLRPAGDDGRRRIERGEASALLVIPQGFQQDYLAGRQVRLQLLRNPSQGILPEIAEQGLTVLVDLLSSASHVLREPLAQMQAMLENDAGPEVDDVTALAAGIYLTVDRAQGYAIPPAIVLQDAAPAAPPASGAPSSSASVFLFVLPGVSVWALFMVGDMAMRDLLAESTAGTLRRQLGGPVPAWQVLVGKTLYAMVLACISLVLLGGIGGVVARRAVDPPGLVLLSLALLLCVSGFASLTYGAARSERQGATVASLLLLVFAMLGGAFFQTSSLPAGVQRLAPLTPFYWGIEGYRLLLQGGDAASVLLHSGILAAAGVLLLALGGSLLHRRLEALP